MSTLPPVMVRSKSWLDRPLPRMVRLFLLVLMSAIPTVYVARHAEPSTGFTSLIFFGRDFMPRALPAVQRVHPATATVYGYDGQFYAQIAVDPTLRDPGFSRAIDGPSYRSQRIFMPLLAYILGAGRPWNILQAYALLNLAFWFLLLAGLFRFLRAASARDYLAVGAIVLSTGALVSIRRALTDLPMTVLAFYSVVTDGALAAILIGLATLTKPTGALLLARYVWPLPANRAEAWHSARLALLALAGPVLWALYLIHLFGTGRNGSGNIGLPFRAWAECVVQNWSALRAALFQFFPFGVSHWEWCLFELLAPLSLMFQVVYLLVRRDLSSRFWWMGLTFAVLFVCLSAASFAEQIAHVRHELPMTIAFNVLLLCRERGVAYAGCFLAGNVGLWWGLHSTIAYCLK